jgi:hypothetical protein
VDSPDGARLATVEGGAGRGQPDHVWVRDAADGRLLLDVEGIGFWGSAGAFSPDGRSSGDTTPNCLGEFREIKEKTGIAADGHRAGTPEQTGVECLGHERTVNG